MFYVKKDQVIVKERDELSTKWSTAHDLDKSLRAGKSLASLPYDQKNLAEEIIKKSNTLALRAIDKYMVGRRNASQ